MLMFAEEWLSELDREDLRSLSMFLVIMLVKHFNFTWTNAEKYAAQATGKGERSVRRWWSSLIKHKGKFPSYRQGRYRWSGVLWQDEDLNKKAIAFVRENANVKGRPNMTTMDFCRWVNNFLLRNTTITPGFPHKVSNETARKWLHHLGFEVLTPRKGIFVDGHERPDVVDQRKEFFAKVDENWLFTLHRCTNH